MIFQLGSLVRSPELEMRELRKGMGITPLDCSWFTCLPTQKKTTY